MYPVVHFVPPSHANYTAVPIVVPLSFAKLKRSGIDVKRVLMSCHKIPTESMQAYVHVLQHYKYTARLLAQVLLSFPPLKPGNTVY